MKKTVAVFSVFATLLLSGCPAAVWGGVTGGLMANDNRTVGSFIEDELIENKIRLRLLNDIGNKANVGITSYNRFVLLTGQAPTEELHRHILAVVKSIENVRGVHDKMEIVNPSSFSARSSDTALTARVKTALCRLQIENFSCLDVKVVTEKGVVYLLGLLTREQEAIAIKTTRSVKGVLKVVKIIQRNQ